MDCFVSLSRSGCEILKSLSYSKSFDFSLFFAIDISALVIWSLDEAKVFFFKAWFILFISPSERAFLSSFSAELNSSRSISSLWSSFVLFILELRLVLIFLSEKSIFFDAISYFLFIISFWASVRNCFESWISLL